MVKVVYDKRLLIDKNFFIWFKNFKIDNSKEYFDTCARLLRIKSTSKQYKGTHNVILENDFDYLVREGIFSNNLKGFVKSIEQPDFINDVDEITINVRTAVYLTNEKPYKVVILTSPEKLNEYEINDHFKELSSVYAKADKEALQIIDNLFKQYIECKC